MRVYCIVFDIYQRLPSGLISNFCDPNLQGVSFTVLVVYRIFTAQPLPLTLIFSVELVIEPQVCTFAVDWGYCSKVNLAVIVFAKLSKSGTNLLTDINWSPSAISTDPVSKKAVMAVPSAWLLPVSCSNIEDAPAVSHKMVVALAVVDELYYVAIGFSYTYAPNQVVLAKFIVYQVPSK